jgi:hypothetical protein
MIDVVNMVPERGELSFLITYHCFEYPLEVLLQGCPVLCPALGFRQRVSLGRTPSLHPLRRTSRSSTFVRRLLRYYAFVRLLLLVHQWIAPIGLPLRITAAIARDQTGDLPVPAQDDSAHARGLRPRRSGDGLASSARLRVAFHLLYDVGPLRLNLLSRLNTRPMHTPVNASPPPSRVTAHDSGPLWVASPST